MNLNFWLTPDESNVDSSTGGLDIYRRLPTKAQLRDFARLNQVGGHPIREYVYREKYIPILVCRLRY